VCTSLQPGSAQSGKPFRVAFMAGLSGPEAQAQQAILQGAQLAAKRVNSQGGILGRPVEITVFDHQFDPSRAVSMLQQDILTQNWDVIYAGGGARTTGPMLPFLANVKVLQFAPFITTTDLATLTTTNPTFFDVLPSLYDAASAFAQYAQKVGVKKIAILYQTDPYGAAVHTAYEAAAKKLGITVVSEGYDTSTVDITPTLIRLKAENPDHLFASALGSPAGHVLNSLDKLGWDVPLIGDVTFGTTNLPALAPERTYSKLVVQAYHSTVYVPPDKRSGRLKAFLTDLASAGPITQGFAAYAVGWDVIMLTSLAAKQANSTDAMKMVHALERLDVPERSKTFVGYDDYGFTPTNHGMHLGPREYSFIAYTPLSEGMVGRR
jgi:branched-chain amino acid transport system substrate-binding protein